jgi:hypothetical protein
VVLWLQVHKNLIRSRNENPQGTLRSMAKGPQESPFSRSSIMQELQVLRCCRRFKIWTKSQLTETISPLSVPQECLFLGLRPWAAKPFSIDSSCHVCTEQQGCSREVRFMYMQLTVGRLTPVCREPLQWRDGEL